MRFSKNTLLLLLASSWSSSMNMADAQGQSLLGGRFETTTDVQMLLNLALDAADMKETSDWDQKKNIYQNVRTSSVGLEYYAYFYAHSQLLYFLFVSVEQGVLRDNESG